MIDIAVPRDIDPAVADMEGIYLFNIDSLESVVEEIRHSAEEEDSSCRAYHSRCY